MRIILYAFPALRQEVEGLLRLEGVCAIPQFLLKRRDPRRILVQLIECFRVDVNPYNLGICPCSQPGRCCQGIQDTWYENANRIET